MAKKVPTTSGVIVSTGTKLGLFQIVEYIAGVFDVNFNDNFYQGTATLPTETILHCFGLADRYVKADGTAVPLMYSQSGGTLQDPIDLLPTDRWPGYMFFDRTEPIQFSVPNDYTQLRGYVKETAKVSIIFFFNMKTQRYYSKWGADYRIQKEALRERILKVLTVQSQDKKCEFAVNSVTDGSVADVFKGYDVKDAQLIADLQPYYALRFETTITYRYLDCAPNANSSFKPAFYTDVNMDAIKINLTKDVPYPVTFQVIEAASANNWMFTGVPLCNDTSGQSIGYSITDKTATGFTVTAIEDSVFNALVIQI